MTAICQYQPDVKERALDLVMRGYPATRVARAVNVEDSTVRRWIKAAGIVTTYMARQTVRKKVAEAVPIIDRKCLCCRNEFPAKGPFIRVCTSCKEKEVWRS